MDNIRADMPKGRERVILISPNARSNDDYDVILDPDQYDGVDIQRLIRTATRMRPDRIVIDTDDVNLKQWVRDHIEAADIKVSYLSDEYSHMPEKRGDIVEEFLY